MFDTQPILPRSRGSRCRSGRLPSLVMAVVLLGGLLAAGGFVRPAAIRAQVTAEATASLAPADAPVFFAMSIDGMSTQWAGAEALLRRIGLGDEIDQALTDMRAELTSELGPDATDLLAGSEFGFVVSHVGAMTGETDVSSGDEGSGLIGIMAAPSGAAEIHAAQQRLMEQRAADFGETVSRSTYNGVTILAVPGDQAIAQFDDYFVLADTPGDLYPVLDVRTGDRASLAANETFAAVRDDLPAEALAFAYVDGEALRVPFQQQMFEEPESAPIVAAVLPQLTHRFGLALSVVEAGLQLDLRLAPGTGVAAPGDRPAPDLLLDEAVAADSVLFFNGVELGASDGFETLVLLLAQGMATVVTVDSGVVFLEPAQYFDVAAGMLTFDLRDGFARQLTGEYALAASATSFDVGGIDVVLVSGVDDSLLVADAAAKIAVLLNAATFDSGYGAGQSSGPRRVDGGLIQVLDLPIDGAGTELHLEFGVVGERFLVGYRSGLSDFLAGPAATLADNPRYRDAMAALPAARDWQFYLDLGRLIPLLQQADESFANDTESLDLSPIESLSAAGFTRNGLRGMTMVLAVTQPADGLNGSPVASPEAE